MPTFKNTSESVFQDGDLVVLPGESFSTEDEGRIHQMRTMYAWQFSEGSAKAPHEDEVKATSGSKDVREIRDHAFVSRDADGKQKNVEGHSA